MPVDDSTAASAPSGDGANREAFSRSDSTGANPGALARSKRGLTAKVLNERLAKLSDYGVLEKRSFAEIPPRVEYWFTPFGERFVDLLDKIEDLRREFS